MYPLALLCISSSQHSLLSFSSFSYSAVTIATTSCHISIILFCVVSLSSSKQSFHAFYLFLNESGGVPPRVCPSDLSVDSLLFYLLNYAPVIVSDL